VAELFEKVDLERTPRWPIMLRLTGGSIVLHALVILSVLYVPAIRDAVNIAGALTGTRYVDRAYKKTVVRDEVTMLLMNEKFEYPPGYFPATMPEPTPEPLIPDMGSLFPQAQQLPRIIPTPVPTPDATPSPVASPSPGASGQTTTTAAGQPTPTPGVSNDKEMDRIAADNGIVRPNEDTINKRPLKDWLARANEMKVKGQLDLSKPVEIVIEAELGADGRLINPVVVQKSGDERLIEVAKDMVSAISDSGALIFLKDPKQPNLNIRQMRLTLKLDQTSVTAKVESEMETAERAQKVASGYNLLLGIGQLKKSGQDEEVIYKNTKVTANGKQVVVDFTLPRPQAETMIKKQLPAT
jgi:hypothetical protein